MKFRKGQEKGRKEKREKEKKQRANFLDKFYFSFYKILPKRYKEKIKALLIYSNIKIKDWKWLGFFTSYGIFCSLIGFAFTFLILKFPISFCVICAILILLTSHLIPYYLLVVSADRRARYIEEVLPDVLQTTSANLRAGMPLSVAFWQSANPELGPMAEEINRVSAEIFAGKSFVQAIEDMSKRVKSNVLRRVSTLISEGVKAGGNMADLLDGIAENLRSMKNIKDEISAKVKGYYASILFGVSIGTPLLLALALNLVANIQLMTQQLSSMFEEVPPTTPMMQIPLASMVLGFLRGGGTTIDLSLLELYAYVVIATSSIFGGVLVSVVIHGKEIKSIKYIPLLLGVSIALFLIFRMLLRTLVFL